MLAYLGMRQNDDAIAAFKKQIEVNPYDEYAYNALGRAYWQERKYDDAVYRVQQADRNQSARQVCPCRIWARCIPSGTKYDLAAAELEKATSLTPDNAGTRKSVSAMLI